MNGRATPSFSGAQIGLAYGALQILVALAPANLPRLAELSLDPMVLMFALGLSLLGFALIGASGLLMFAGQPAELLANRIFVIKMGLVMLAGLNAAWFHARGSLQLLDREARLQTVVSTGLWLAVIICGRWIAYA